MSNDMITFIIDIILLMIAIIMHEYGHYYACILQKVPAQLELTKCRVKVIGHTTQKQNLIITSMGPLVGLIPILFTSNVTWFMFIYLLGCTMDFVIIANILMKTYKVNKPTTYSSFETMLLKATHEKKCECRSCLDTKRKEWVNGKKFSKTKEPIVINTIKPNTICLFKER